MEKVKVDELEVYKQIVLKGEDSQKDLVSAVGHMVCYRRDLELRPVVLISVWIVAILLPSLGFIRLQEA